MKQKNDKSQAVIIKKYANRRLYNTDTSSYITLDDLYDMVRREVEFAVRDAKTGDDITNQILTQIILERESNGMNLLPTSFLRGLIGFYEGEAGSLLPPYLEAMMSNFNQHQKQWADSMQHYNAFGQLEEIGKQNMELFEQTMRAFNPLAGKK